MEHLSIIFLKALRVYLKLKQRSAIQESLKEGYLEMAGESKRIMNDFKNPDRESLGYVD